MNNAQFKPLSPIEAHQAALDGEQPWFSNDKKNWRGPCRLGKIDAEHQQVPYKLSDIEACVNDGWYKYAAIRVPMPDTPPLEDLKAIRRVMGSGWIYQDSGNVYFRRNNIGLPYSLRGIERYTEEYDSSELDLDETIKMLEGAG